MTTTSSQRTENEQKLYASYSTTRIKTDQSFPIFIMTLPRACLVAIRAYALTTSSISHTESISRYIPTLPNTLSLRVRWSTSGPSKVSIRRSEIGSLILGGQGGSAVCRAATSCSALRHPGTARRTWQDSSRRAKSAS